MTTKTRTIRHPQSIEESKMQGYFMISRRDAASAITNKLTGSQCRLWLYLMLIDPFADRTAAGEIKYHDLPPIPEIAIALGSSADTVEKDLRKLRKLGLYEYRTVKVQGHNSTAAKARLEAERLKTKTETKSKSKTKSKTSSKPSQNKDSAYLSSDGDYLSSDGDYLSGNSTSEHLSDKNFSAPSDRSDRSKLLQTLSKEEREDFLNFGIEKAKKLPNPPELPIKWIEKNWQEIEHEWRKSRGERTNIPSRWETDPRTSNWLAICEEMRNPLQFAEGDKEKLEFVKWANKNKKFSWHQRKERQ